MFKKCYSQAMHCLFVGRLNSNAVHSVTVPLSSQMPNGFYYLINKRTECIELSDPVHFCGHSFHTGLIITCTANYCIYEGAMCSFCSRHLSAFL